MYDEESDKLKRFASRRSEPSINSLKRKLKTEKKIIVGMVLIVSLVLIIGGITAFVGWGNVGTAISKIPNVGFAVKSQEQLMKNNPELKKFNGIDLIPAKIDLSAEENNLKSDLAKKCLTEKNTAKEKATSDAKSACTSEKAALSASLESDIEKWKNKYDDCRDNE